MATREEQDAAESWRASIEMWRRRSARLDREGQDDAEGDGGCLDGDAALLKLGE